MHETYGTMAPTGELLTRIACVQRALTAAQAAAVARGRAQHETHASLAVHLAMSPDHFRKKFSKEYLHRTLGNYANPWKEHGLLDGKGADGLPGHEPSLPRAQKCSERRAPDRLRAALSHATRRSQATQRTLAQAIKRHPSYVSRLLSGEKPLHWPYVQAFARTLGIAERLLLPLYNVAADIEPPPGTDPVAYLRDYLGGLLLASGHTRQTLNDALTGTLTPATLREALDGPRIPNWGVHEQLAAALFSLPSDMRPLWQAAYHHAAVQAHITKPSSLHAEHFG
ncbi:helix-turn-helix domain-containing protein [Streptomyces sp. NRRL F-5630]|uniref:helix-turn-helix domain-containing protein n=1 Tax=Streptomyces sp. NRRL F-5630 TaxID=1463864 RepID=UPI000B0E44C8|nr:helix-turn-helix transcriptional regulator [Streptomyces sp. NRRL F-5630]